MYLVRGRGNAAHLLLAVLRSSRVAVFQGSQETSNLVIRRNRQEAGSWHFPRRKEVCRRADREDFEVMERVLWRPGRRDLLLVNGGVNILKGIGDLTICSKSRVMLDATLATDGPRYQAYSQQYNSRK